MVDIKNNIAVNGTYNIGHNYKPGIYFVEVIQGKQRAKAIIIKQ